MDLCTSLSLLRKAIFLLDQNVKNLPYFGICVLATRGVWTGIFAQLWRINGFLEFVYEKGAQAKFGALDWQAKSVLAVTYLPVCMSGVIWHVQIQAELSEYLRRSLFLENM